MRDLILACFMLCISYIAWILMICGCVLTYNWIILPYIVPYLPAFKIATNAIGLFA